MVDREKDLYFNPDGELSPIPLPVEMQFGHRDGITGKESLREIFSSSRRLAREHPEVHDLISSFQERGNKVYADISPHKGLILRVGILAAGVTAGGLLVRELKKKQERQKNK